jgi:dipeptidyl aminopeptidase/acylaminoacyl peptidase
LRVDVSGLTLALALIAGGGLVVALLRALLHHGIRASLAAPRIGHDRTPGDLGLPFETLRLDTANARRVHAWLVAPVADGDRPAPAVIVMHGWGGNAAMMLPLARPLRDAGFAALYVDARCHGASDGDSFASLPRFAEDIEHAADWLARQPGIDAARISVIGHSVGAGAALLAATRRPGLAAVVSIAAFSHPATMMRRWFAARRIPERTVGRYILGFVEKTIGHRFDDIAPVSTIARVRCPVLLVHGESDDVVPLSEARQLLAARADNAVELRVIGGSHESFADPERHVQEAIAFLRRANRL